MKFVIFVLVFGFVLLVFVVILLFIDFEKNWVNNMFEVEINDIYFV